MTRTSPESPAADALPIELVERFAAALGRLNPDARRIGLAVSGGPDSMAMLLLAQTAIPGLFEVATVNHGLRIEAEEECALVAAACEARGIACTIIAVKLEPGNLQDRARQARYAALVRWARERDLAAIATAHHADDQAETLLMRLNRGSGLAGLAGVRESTVQAGLPVLRPVLSFRRSELQGVVAEAGLPFALDPSNEDERFDRVRLRKALAEADWVDPLALAASARHLAEAEVAVETFANELWQRLVCRRDDALVFTPQAPRMIRLRIVERIIGEFGNVPRGTDISRLVDRLDGGEGGNLGGVLAKVEGTEWVFLPEPPRRTG